MASLTDELMKKWGVPGGSEKVVEPEKPKSPKKTNRPTKEKVAVSTPVSSSYQDLVDQAREAELKQEIYKADQLAYKIEQERLKLEKESGKLIEYSLAEFLFIGFMEKTNLQMLGMIKKLEPDLINLCRENEPQELLRLLTTNIESVVIDIKNQQKKDVENWERDR